MFGLGRGSDVSCRLCGEAARFGRLLEMIMVWGVRVCVGVWVMDQICSLAWSKNVNELVSTHGYSQNQIVVWRYPSMSKVATLTGHNLRVLYLVRA
jgi:hypothetical protein